MRKKFFALLLSFSLVLPYLASSATKAYAVSSVMTVTAPSEDVLWPAIQPDSTGYLHFAWHQTSGVYYSRWNGDTWSSPLKISNNTKDLVAYYGRPSLSTDSSNNVYAVWTDPSYNDNYTRIAYRTRTPGNTGTWGNIEALNLPSGTIEARNASISIDGNGLPNVVYTATNSNGSTQTIYWTKKLNGNWTQPVAVGLDQNGNSLPDPYYSRIKTDSFGNLHISYWSGFGIYYRKYLSSNQTWQTPVQLSNSNNAEYVSENVTPGGQVFVGWFEAGNTSIRERHTAGGVWQSETNLTTTVALPQQTVPVLGVTTDSKENAYIGWTDNGGVPGAAINLDYKTFSGGSWGSVQTFQTGVIDAATPYVIADKFDNQHFAWAEKDPSTGFYKLNYRVAEGTSQTVVRTSGGTIQMAANGQNYGDLTVPINSLSTNGTPVASALVGIQIGPVPDTVSPTQVTIPRAYTFRPSGTTFSPSATAHINYSTSEIGAADASLLRPWFWDATANSGAGGWVAQTGATVNTTTHVMSAPLAHFSLYGISAPIVNTTWNTPDTKGHTLTYSFNLSYADGTKFRKITGPTDLYLNLKNSSENVVLTVQYGKENGPKQVGKNLGDFEGKADLNKLKLPSGNYTIEVVLAGGVINTQNISF